MILQEELLAPPGRYRHYKGGFYTVLGVARHSETEEPLVVYRSETQGGLWVRPLSMWLETVNSQPRFALVDGIGVDGTGAGAGSP
ncbi:hypothetical protein AA23498_1560 [Acetobacter nitrogenifigens DSM 23921 = NBRC 105050]|uniref:DUF1653 domain-containing protein n=1 Tax=Acetobacter nitrogenifigens DSM 23921 = NBRC 105050 TaxID=1120919 RepID=A0A511XB65_9PROT|nr:hypothetical protein AA23498_1560 [Acetobacter nitrogenifigens DSM 23921 = NBRC 105050]GEN60142.1 hypothetical protein ANI02nite_20260 [Acetobacter nitrogenifigens DSM 23921 = NBRC 105050]